jgi:hypothetical protein
MSTIQRRAAGVVIVALGLALFADTASALAQKMNGAAIDQIADAMGKGKKADADKLAAALAKKLKGVDEVAIGFSQRKRGGFGVGKAGILGAGDSIELALAAIEQKGISKEALKSEAEALTKAANRTSAIAEVLRNKRPLANKKAMKAWDRLAMDMGTQSLDLVEAIKSGDPAKVKSAVTMLNGTCNACHAVFKP